MTHPIKHEVQKQRFTTTVDDHLCVLEYELTDSSMTITHTRVPEAVGGKGIAASLTQVALDTARSNKWRVVPRCSYAAVYIKRHPEYVDLTT
ncbi:GNAT family N-acetyltransferase [Orrella daihaiensis]|uniref:N-acetyltransferase n=1 Tax=Orrella daihaiensis TaxID=2782176 RepID=A0ABY4AHU9_9BURK|nr:GNAT family N-acetyltransferase [Orrella daihaiensis]UOD49658.1 N-acetyltransferase [Orrella daihaiensis]